MCFHHGGQDISCNQECRGCMDNIICRHIFKIWRVLSWAACKMMGCHQCGEQCLCIHWLKIWWWRSQGGHGTLVSFSHSECHMIPKCACRPFAIVKKSDGQSAVEVDNDGKKQQFVSVWWIPGPFFDTFFQSAKELLSMVLVKMCETAEQYLNKKVKWVIDITTLTLWPIGFIKPCHYHCPGLLQWYSMASNKGCQSNCWSWCTVGD